MNQSKYYKYKNKYLSLKNQMGGGGYIIRYSETLYRVRSVSETNAPNFSHPLWFVDNLIDIFYVWKYRTTQHPTLDPKVLKNLIVDIYEVIDPLKLFYFNRLKYSDVQRYIIEKFPSFKIIDGDESHIDNHILASFLNEHVAEFRIDGWFERGVPKIAEVESLENMNEIMLLSSAKDKLKYKESKTVDEILSGIFRE
jgi:hypothetical protein